MPELVDLRSDTVTKLRQTLGQAFVEMVQGLPGVARIYLSYEEGTIHIWTVLSAQHKDIRRDVYECELALMEQFLAYEYDFHVIGAADNAIEELLPPQAEALFSPRVDDAFRTGAHGQSTPQ